jgi:zinc protease
MLLAAGLFSTPLSAQTAPVVESFTLSNGMEVIVIENHRIPAVSHTLWFRVGAADDPPGKSGIAHYHEHMMFQGAQKYPAGKYEELVARYGGEQNAFTGRDTTAYYIHIGKDRLPMAMELEADRMRGLTASDAGSDKEKQVIIEERRQRIENNPEALLDEQIDAALFRHHPYRIPVIGWMHEMAGLTKKDVLDFHQRYYHPNNAILIVSGDITAKELRPLAQKYYGGLARGKLPERRWNAEPPQNNARRITMHHPNVKQPLLKRSYMASSLGYGSKEDALPLMALSQMLGSGKTSRLYQALVVEEKLASNADVSYNGFSIGPAVFAIEVTPEKDVDPAAVEKALDKALAKLIAEGITDAELIRAKTQLKAEAIYARDGLAGMARIMGWLRIAGLDADYFARWPALIDGITKEQIVNGAKHSWQINQSVTALLLPPVAQEKTP